MILILVLIAVFIALFFGASVKEDAVNFAKVPGSVTQRYNIAKKWADIYGVPVKYVMATIWTESTGNMLPDGKAGEKGVMQLKPIAVLDVRENGDRKFLNWQTDVNDNIGAGTAFLALMKKRHKTWKEAIRAYNQGGAGKDREGTKELADIYYQKVNDKAQFFS